MRKGDCCMKENLNVLYSETFHKEKQNMCESRKSEQRSVFKTKEFIRNTLLVLLAVLWSVASYFQWAIENRTVAFQTPQENVAAIEIQQGDVFSQEIHINRFLKNLKICTANGGVDRALTNHGTLRLTLRQGDVSEICDLDINGIADWTYVDFSGSLKRFHDGIATLEISSLDTQYGSSLFIAYTGEDIYEIPSAYFNGEPLPGPLIVQYETGNPRPIRSTVWIVAALLLLAVIAAGFILTKYPKNILVYAVTIVLVFLTICLKYPNFTIDGEAWGEVGALYIPSAQNKGFFQNLFVLENGLYLNIIARLITWFAVHCCPTLVGIVLAMNLMGTLLVSAMGSALSTGALKKYITPLESVLISVLVTTCLVDAESIATPLITAYWGIVPMLILLAIIIFRVDISNKLYWLLGAMAILSTLSRMIFVIFIPVLLVVAFLQRRKLTRRDILFVTLEIITCLFQGIFTLVIRKRMGLALTGEEGLGVIKIGNPLQLLNETIYAQTQFVNTLFRVQNCNFLWWNLLLLAVFIGGCGLLLVCIVKKKHYKTSVFALVMLLISVGNTIMIPLTMDYRFLSNGWRAIRSLPKHRYFMFSFLAFVGIALMFFICLRKSGVYQRERGIRVAGTAIMALSMLIICSCQTTESGYFFYDNPSETGNWEKYSQMASHEEFVIPAAPTMEWKVPWLYQSPNSQIKMSDTEKNSSLLLDQDTPYAISLYVHKDTRQNQIHLNKYYVSVYDKNGELAATVPQISDPEEAYAGFDLDMPIDGISRVEFTLEDGRPAYIDGTYILGYRGVTA